MSAGQPERHQGGDPVAVLHTAADKEAAKRELRDVMARFATGITVLTAHGADAHGMTANSFTSVSLDPPMVLCCVARTARMHQTILDARAFGVSVLGGEQEGLARYFATRGRPTGMAQFDQVDWFPGRHTGVPLLTGSLAWLECDLEAVYDGGDHSIFLGLVREASCGTGQALLFLGGGMHRYDPPSAAKSA
ncbi:FMN reductase (NADH) NtaB [Actinosynnema sp. ALI-1.44]|uniref:Flavin reductase family protein n=2 Tax=Saccharothrix mutabilis TaxID=33921 RepID=A0ABP3DZ30_9PSEU